MTSQVTSTLKGDWTVTAIQAADCLIKSTCLLQILDTSGCQVSRDRYCKHEPGGKVDPVGQTLRLQGVVSNRQELV